MKKLLFIAILFALQSAMSQELARRANWQAKFTRIDHAPGVVVKEITPGSPLAQMGTQAGDIFLKVNDRSIATPEDWDAITYGIRADQKTQILFRRNDVVKTLEVELNALEKEHHEQLDTYYESVISDFGVKQRTIITKPKNTSGKLPAIVLIQGLSCSTIEKYPGRSNNWVNQINTLVENSGMVVMRVDKPGVGDSEGDCSETDFVTELGGYRAAIRSLKAKAYVDTTKIIVYGASMGSALAPLLANEFGLAGVISDGTFFKSWFEHMLEIERRIRRMSGDTESEIVKKMNQAFIPLYYGMLIKGKTYEEVIKESPALVDYNYHSPRHMYGRPVAYYQQLQQFDLAGAWESVKVPVRVLYGSNDWIMSEFDNRMIMDVLDRNGHEDHELLIYPGLDHWNTIHEKPEYSFLGKPGKWDPKVPEIIIGWAQEMAR